jgi:hypothetical protein
LEGEYRPITFKNSLLKVYTLWAFAQPVFYHKT